MSLNRRNCPRPLPVRQSWYGLGPGARIRVAHTWHGLRPPSRRRSNWRPSRRRRGATIPKARALFDEVSKAYKASVVVLRPGEFVVAMTAAGKSDKQVVPLKVTLVRPNKFEIDTNVVRLTSDGKTLTTSVIPLKRYMAVPAPEKVDIETFREGPIGASLFGGPSGVPMFVLLNLLTAADPAAAIAQIGGSLQLAGASGPKPDGAKAATPRS